MAIDCAQPKEIPKQYPCLQCLSESELIKLLVVILNDQLAILDPGSQYDLPAQTNHLLADSACYNCLSDKQMLEALVAILAFETYGEGTSISVEGIRQDIKCLLCTPPRMARAAALLLACRVTQAMGLGD